MIRLALVRHAKSDWGDASLPDHDRPLNDRGRRDAPRMAARLAESGFRPDVILSSTAVRARTTAGFFSKEFGTAIDLQETLYGAPASVLLRAAAESGATAAMVVAHDPGMSELAEQLSGGGIAHMPTCAVATFAWDADEWEVATALDPDDWTLDTPR
ncbi:SixA phosphatase family protein [Microbacterium sp. CFBP9034]|uniref:SixA phosphatase family protein n=1 Tax=Microbacterium sp. CFBP9034 TaxID=3096540 RepID=UPI002A6AFC75|nr:histidine phosphatase family protein [Microbacterium sp. CFBP9034]MDY0910944.1 histidine phosphatase family protein [Microbacterium sp. CFBP9034]